LIDAGLIWHHQLHDCEPFEGYCMVTQCFKCYKFGHIARFCQNLLRCGCCAASGHIANDCLSKDDKTKHRCVNCCGKHQSWARNCPERATHAADARQAYNERPTHFQSQSQSQPPPNLGLGLSPTPTPTLPLTLAVAPVPATLAPAAPVLAAAAPVAPAPAQANCSYQQPTVEDEDEQQWTQVRNWRTTGPPTGPPEKHGKASGRPLGSTKAAKNAKDIRDVFKGLYE
jgi:hypothetical protein